MHICMCSTNLKGGEIPPWPCVEKTLLATLQAVVLPSGNQECVCASMVSTSSIHARALACSNRGAHFEIPAKRELPAECVLFRCSCSSSGWCTLIYTPSMRIDIYQEAL